MEELIKAIKIYNPDANLDLIKKAYHFAETAHFGQKRVSGEPFFNHVLATGKVLAQWKMDTYSIAAGLLHDSIEDGAATKEVCKTPDNNNCGCNRTC